MTLHEAIEAMRDNRHLGDLCDKAASGNKTALLMLSGYSGLYAEESARHRHPAAQKWIDCQAALAAAAR